jgi:DUF4097 and DUF4098 domain-containing protein YvlB
MNPSRALKLIPLVLGFASCAWLGEPKTLNETRALDLNGITKLEVIGIAGNFSVTRGNAAGLLIHGVGRVAVTSIRTGSTFRVASSGDTNCYPCTVDIDIVVPEPLELALKASNGNVNVTNSATVATLESGNGKISVDGVNDLNAKTSNGEIYAVNLKGQAVLSSNNGKITLEKAVLPAASLNSIRTSNGDIRLNTVTTDGGFVITGNTSTPAFQLLGFDLKTATNTFTATRAGQNPTTLTLETGNGAIQVNP